MMDGSKSIDRDPGAHPSVDPYVALARTAVESFVSEGRIIEVPDWAPDEMLGRRAGAFVSLHLHGELRGCIGTIAPVQDNLAAEIIRNGILAATEDPRFPPVAPGELDHLSYSVDVLDPPTPVESPDELDVRRYGVVVSKGFRRGLLLPNLEGVDSVGMQLAIAKRKAGIDPYDEDVAIQRFEVVRHERGGEPNVG